VERSRVKVDERESTHAAVSVKRERKAGRARRRTDDSHRRGR
jgi:hypothetical protein